VEPAGTNVAVIWLSVPGISYFLECSTDLSPVPSFTTIATNLAGEGISTMYIHTNAAPGPRLFYRVGVSQ
jgi:hypothetical protein